MSEKSKQSINLKMKTWTLTDCQKTIFDVSRKLALYCIFNTFLRYFAVLIEHGPQMCKTSLAQNLIKPAECNTTSSNNVW